MAYLEEFRAQITNRDFSKFWQLWEEYCTSDTVEVEEFLDLLKMIKASDFNRQFGQYVETALPLWETIKDKNDSYEVLKLLIDLQTTNSPKLAEITLNAIKEKYPNDPQLNERLRLVGLRTKENFQNALANYDLLYHMEKGKYVIHTGGWGAGEIVDISPVREQLTVEFEHIPGRKYFTLENSFKNLLPLASDSFLARRFADADELEKDAREDSVKVIKQLLQDLGPKNAAEIKDEMCGLVIPEKDWAKWWQGTRSKLKKDTMIETPEALRDSFRLRKTEVTHEQRFHTAIGKQSDIDDIIQTSYSFARDMPAMLKKQDVKEQITSKLLAALSNPEITHAQELQILIFLESTFDHKIEENTVQKIIEELDDFEEIINAIEIVAFKKRVLTLIRQYRQDWKNIFLKHLFSLQQSTLRDYMLKELNQEDSKRLLIEKLNDLCQHPLDAPEFFVWYFQKIIGKNKDDLPFSNKEGHLKFFESFLILFSLLDGKPEYRDLSKKMYTLMSSKRYAVVRGIIEGTTLEYIKEFLLLASKCQTFTDHDQKILRSLAEVVHPSLVQNKQRKESATLDGLTLWTTEEGYNRTKEHLQRISTVELVETAREIEAARALGDLRENSEYKFAQEKRARLQSEMKHLSDLLNRARIITKADISLDEVGVGTIVDLKDSKGSLSTFTILGPWDADPDKGILSSQSKFSQALAGLKKGDKFLFRDEEYEVMDLRSFFQN